MAKNESHDNTKCGRIQRNWGLLDFAAGINGAATLEYSMAVSYIIKYALTVSLSICTSGPLS